MNDIENRMISGLAALEAEVKGMNFRLDRQNGTIVEHAAQIKEIMLHQAERKNQCPLVDAVKLELSKAQDAIKDELRKVQDAQIEDVGAKKDAKVWQDRLWPLIKYVALIAFGMLLVHSKEILEFITK